MDLILLPGNDPKNKNWIEWVSKSVEEKYDRRIVQYYDHWSSGGDINPEKELETLAKTAAELELSLENRGGPKEGYAIFGKSAGVILALAAIVKGIIAPKKCIFVGSAIGFGKRLGYPVEQWLKDFSQKKIPTTFIQQEHDPAIAANDLETLLQQIGFSDYQLVKVPGGDHAYTDLPVESV